MVFWSLEQRRKWAREREAAEREREAAAQEQERRAREREKRELTKLLSDLLDAGIVKPDQKLGRWAREQGIDLSKLPPY